MIQRCNFVVLMGEAPGHTDNIYSGTEVYGPYLEDKAYEIADKLIQKDPNYYEDKVEVIELSSGEPTYKDE
jgi:hypothetical protein